MSDNSLQYLSSEQALADLAAFRQAMQIKFDLTGANKWISFGGSYPGALSAWFRLKYPHLVAGKNLNTFQFSHCNLQGYSIFKMSRKNYES